MNTWTLDNGIDEIRPRNFYEIEKVFSKFIELGEIILDISIMNPDDAQRSVDFFAGGAFALNGESERTNDYRFLFNIGRLNFLYHFSTKKLLNIDDEIPLTLKPRYFCEIDKLFNKFLDQGKITLDLSIMNPDDAQRSVDFFAGGVFALNGEKERLDKRSFLFSISKSTMRNYLKNIFN